jgi:hypothetical protein
MEGAQLVPMWGHWLGRLSLNILQVRGIYLEAYQMAYGIYYYGGCLFCMKRRGSGIFLHNSDARDRPPVFMILVSHHQSDIYTIPS